MLLYVDSVCGIGCPLFRYHARSDMVVRPQPRLFTVEEYHRMGEAGILGEDNRVELINGEIVRMTPSGARTQAASTVLTRCSRGTLSARPSFRSRTPSGQVTCPSLSPHL